MFIRRTQTRSTATGGAYFTHRLVRSERLGGKVRQRTLLNLGRHFDAAQSDWPALCQRIEEVLGGQLQLAPDCPPALESHDTSPPSCSLDTPTSAAPQRRPRDTTFSTSMWTPTGAHPSALGRRRARGTVGDGPARAALVPARVGDWSITARRRYRLDHRAHGTPGLRALPPGAGSANAARSMSCWESTSRPWSRCNSIAPPMR